jgi:hypothetical protein
VRIVPEAIATFPVKLETPETLKRFEGPNPRMLTTGTATLLKRYSAPPVETTFWVTAVGRLVGKVPLYTNVTAFPETLKTVEVPNVVWDGVNVTFWFRPRRVGCDTPRVTPVRPFEFDVKVVVIPYTLTDVKSLFGQKSVPEDHRSPLPD